MKQTFRGVRILAQASGGVALDDVSTSGRKIPTDIASLERYLCRELGGAWSVERRHTYGAMATYYSATSTSCDEPTGSNVTERRAFVKLSSPTRGGRILDAAMALGSREAVAYSEMLPAADGGIGIVTPRCLASGASKHGSRSVLVLEDLGSRGDGRGVDIGEPGVHRPVPEARKILVALAGMHAKLWGKQDTIPTAFSRRNEQASDLAQMIVGSAIPKARKDGLIVENDTADRICSSFARLGGFKGIGGLIDDLQPEARTLVHGDAHGGNVYFNHDGRVGLLDWQTYYFGNPVSDVSAFLFNTLSMEDFIADCDGLILDYISALNEGGVEYPMTVEQVREGIRISAANYITGCLLVLAMPSEESLRKRVYKSWNQYLELADHINAADSLEQHVAAKEEKMRSKKLMHVARLRLEKASCSIKVGDNYEQCMY